MPRPRLAASIEPDVKSAILAIWDQIDIVLGTRNVDWHGRRIINAGDAVAPQDYVTKAQLDALEASGIAGPPGPRGPQGEPGEAGAAVDVTALTELDETWYWPQSRILTAGDGVVFDVSVANTFTIATNILRGTRAAQPAAAANPGALYFVTDTVASSIPDASGAVTFTEAVIEYSDGVSWLPYSSTVWEGGVTSLRISGDVKAGGDLQIDGAALLNGNLDVLGAIDAGNYSAMGQVGASGTGGTITAVNGIVTVIAAAAGGSGAAEGYAVSMLLMGA
jgi:hypothetical protein